MRLPEEFSEENSSFSLARMIRPSVRSNNVIDVLLLTLLVLPWWLPLSDGQLWISFPREALAAGSFACLGMVALATLPRTFVWPTASHVLAAVAVVPLVQGAVGLIEYRGDAVLAALYVLGAAALYAVGANDRRYGGRLSSTLLNALLVAACGSAVLGILQWVGLALPDLWFAAASGGRSAANLGQPNLLATLLVWGLIGIWRLYLPHQAKTASALPGTMAFTGAALLLLGIATTQSRAGAMSVILLAVFLAMPRWREKTAARTRHVFWCMVLAFLVSLLSWEWISLWITSTPVAALDERATPGTRPLHWRLVWDAVSRRPWGGWGWSQVSSAQWALANSHPTSGEILQYSHDLVLDLLLWNGLPLGALLSAGLLWWLVRQTKRATTVDALAAIGTVAAVLLHSMLEFPHAYLHFLWAGALIAGFCEQPDEEPKARPTRASAGWFALLLVTVALVLAFVAILRDMTVLQPAWQAQRFFAARIGSATSPPQVPSVWLLDQLHARVVAEQVTPSTQMPAADLQSLQTVASRYPSASVLFRLAQSQALTGDQAAAHQTLRHLCQVHAEDICKAAQDAWREGEREQPKMRAVVVPAVPPVQQARR
ncbi:PglL family O-oligosaccharyltransferase [Aquincola sp. J276]|uniref:PglL family O-oligosaccharyltransferase n=1 Tax=Aquincola sp. J276 TaxID=2898432 RepID=UPI0021508E1D|nr:O-antigen ligase family protein [Aquincola sp. J276]MCR5865941.1 Wzy polymerase domain-containing protein [Aquincola sp. J276]